MHAAAARAAHRPMWCCLPLRLTRTRHCGWGGGGGAARVSVGARLCVNFVGITRHVPVADYQSTQLAEACAAGMRGGAGRRAWHAPCSRPGPTQRPTAGRRRAPLQRGSRPRVRHGRGPCRAVKGRTGRFRVPARAGVPSAGWIGGEIRAWDLGRCPAGRIRQGCDRLGTPPGCAAEQALGATAAAGRPRAQHQPPRVRTSHSRWLWGLSWGRLMGRVAIFCYATGGRALVGGDQSQINGVWRGGIEGGYGGCAHRSMHLYGMRATSVLRPRDGAGEVPGS